MKECPHCGYAANPDDAWTCWRCGKSMPVSAPESSGPDVVKAASNAGAAPDAAPSAPENPGQGDRSGSLDAPAESLRIAPGSVTGETPSAAPGEGANVELHFAHEGEAPPHPVAPQDRSVETAEQTGEATGTAPKASHPAPDPTASLAAGAVIGGTIAAGTGAAGGNPLGTIPGLSSPGAAKAKPGESSEPHFSNKSSARRRPPKQMRSVGPHRDFAAEIRGNQFRSILLVIMFPLLLTALGWAIGTIWGEPRLGILIAGIVALVTVIATWFGGDQMILSVSGAHPADPVKDRQVINIVEEMRIAAGMPMPEVYIMETQEANAFATGRSPEYASVTVTRGLINTLNREELQAVVAHEMGHVRNLDIRYMMLVAALVGSIALLADLARRSLWWGAMFGGRGRRSSSRNSGGVYAQLIVLIVALVIIVLAPLFSVLLQMAVSRRRELLADASSAELTRNPLALASALDKIERHVVTEPAVEEEMDNTNLRKTANRAMQHIYIINPVKSIGEYSTALFSSHPPTSERIRLLREMAD